MPTNRKPNFFIVGAQKSGTTSLSAWLGRHPEIFMSSPKEPGYLAFGDRGYVYPDGRGRRAPASSYVVDKESEYLDLFAGATAAHKVIGESSTWYFSLDGMAERIKRFSPDARILVVLRNPVARAHSAWAHARRDELEPCNDFRKALALEESRGEVEFLLRYHRMGLYSDALADYQRVFGASRLLVLLHEDLQDDRAELWQRLCDYLGVGRVVPPPQRSLNRSGSFRSRRLQRLLDAGPTRALARRLMPYRLRVGVKKHLDDINLQDPPALATEDRNYLEDYYRKDIERLAEMLDRDLSAWLS